MIEELRRRCSGEILSYTTLMDHLRDYATPRNKISRMLHAGEIIRIKKGLYVFGDRYRQAPIHRGLLANLIYGPSYASGLYALSEHSLIPERVETVTSMTTQRRRQFDTPLARFEYFYLNTKRYSVGIDWKPIGNHEHCLLASPEKALADLIARDRNWKNVESLLEFLIENLRIDEESLRELNLERMTKIIASYGNRGVRLLGEALVRLAHG